MPTDPVAGQPRICFCQCGFATDDSEWFELHQRQHDIGRLHDVDAYTLEELAEVRRGLAASLALVRPNSPARIPILAQMAAIDVRLAQLAADAQTALPAWRARGTRGRGATFKGA